MDSPIIGVYPTLTALRQLVESLKQAIENSIRTSASPIERHNAYTDYCIGLLLCATGHRAISDPFQSLTQFNLEEGLLLISDKVYSESRAWRLVALPPLAIDQVRAYLAYLPKLASVLRQNHKNAALCREISALAEGKSGSMPLFFYLTENAPPNWEHVAPGTMDKRWEKLWPLPVKFLRHVTATELFHRTGQADWVQIQLGHMTGIDHPMGITATQSPIKTLKQIAPELESLLKHLGWHLIRPPLRSTSVNLTFESKTKKGHRKGKNNYNLLGHQKRLLQRITQRQRASSMIRDLVSKSLPDKPLFEITREEFNNFFEDIIQEATNQNISKIHALNLVYRWMRQTRGGIDLLRRVSKIRPIEPEPSPFNEDTLSNYHKLKKARHGFINYLDRLGRDESAPFRNQRLAEIIICASLFGGICCSSWLSAMTDLDPESVYRIGENIYLEIPLKKCTNPPVFRWHPDPISFGLLIGFLAPLRPPPNVESNRTTQQWVKLILRTISDGIVDSIVDLSKLANAGITLEMPGYISSVLKGETSAVSLPRSEFLRVLRDEALDSQRDRPAALSRSTDWLPRLTSGRSKNSSLSIATFESDLQNIIRSCRNVSLSGNEKARHKRKKQLSKALKNYTSNTDGWTHLSIALSGWTIHLCRFGTRFKSDIAYNTISDYVQLITTPLIHLIGEKPLLNFEDVEFEEIYLRALDYVQGTRREKLAGRLLEFHYFLVQNYAVADIDWSAIMGACGISRYEYYADANFVRESEYLQLIGYISRDHNIHAVLRIQYATLLLLGYRFGLRFGEAWRLQYRDVQYNEDLQSVWIYIRDTIYGEVKSLAGTRLVPTLERLTHIEKDIFERLLSMAEQSFQSDRLTPLMAAGSQRNLIDRSSAANYLNGLLRDYTGSTQIRFHHLRHSWATRFIGYTFIHTDSLHDNSILAFLPNDIDNQNMEDFLGYGPIQYPLRSISTAAGHANESTTLSSYCHCVDYIAKQFTTDLSPKISDFSQAYCLQTAYATIRRRRSRL